MLFSVGSNRSCSSFILELVKDISCSFNLSRNTMEHNDISQVISPPEVVQMDPSPLDKCSKLRPEIGRKRRKIL